MAILYNAAIGNAASATSSTGSLNHAALVAIIINIAYIGTTSPNAVTVGGVSATLVTGSKVSSGTNNSTEVWFIWKAAAANETVSVGFATSTRHAWNAVSYTGAANAYEDVLTANSTGASPVTTSVTPAAGTTGRLLINCVGIANSANATGSITIVPANSETQRDSTRALAGSASVKAISAEFQEYNDNSGTRALKTTGTLASATLDWAVIGFGLKPAVTFNVSITEGKVLADATGDKDSVTRNEPRTIGDSNAVKSSITRNETRTIGDTNSEKFGWNISRSEGLILSDGIVSNARITRNEPFTIGDAGYIRAIINVADGKIISDSVLSKPSITRIEPRVIGDNNNIRTSLTLIDGKVIGDSNVVKVSINNSDIKTTGDSNAIKLSIPVSDALVIGDIERTAAGINIIDGLVIGETIQSKPTINIADIRTISDYISIVLLGSKPKSNIWWY